MTDASRWRVAAPLAVAGAIWLLPHGGFTARSWGLLCLYAATVCALITRPIPPGALILIAATTGTLLHLFSVQDALSGYGNVIVWLIVAAFLFSRAFVKTRLGERLAYTIVERLGRSPLRLGYSIVLADLVMAPMTPSNTARAGGILFPITLNVARAFGSEPGPTASRMGAFLMNTLYQGDLVVSAMFLTATAPNPLVVELAHQQAGITVSWVTWAMAASVPGALADPRRSLRRVPPVPARSPRDRNRPGAGGRASRRHGADDACRSARCSRVFAARPAALAHGRVARHLGDDRRVPGAVPVAAHARARLAGPAR